MPTEFLPGPDTQRAFRDALGLFGTGVTVVTTTTAQGPVGITANSFSSLSLDPPLVLWSPAKAARRATHFLNAPHYAIHVLTQDQFALCARFAADGFDFDGLDWAPNENNTPLIAGCLARFECRRTALHDGGDHKIVVGQVEKAATADGDPLMFFKGTYGAFASAI